MKGDDLLDRGAETLATHENKAVTLVLVDIARSLRRIADHFAGEDADDGWDYDDEEEDY
jgi:hypothetical protein